VDLPTAPTINFNLLLASIGVGEQTVLEPLAALDASVKASINSYLGLQLAMVEHGHAVTATMFAADTAPDDIATSLQLPLNLLVPVDPPSAIVFYAATGGAFVDLAADLTYALQLPPPTTGPSTTGVADQRAAGNPKPAAADRIMLDRGVAPTTMVAGLLGLDERSVINRAVGVLIENGHHPDHAPAVLQDQAAAANRDLPGHAAAVLQQVTAIDDPGDSPGPR